MATMYLTFDETISSVTIHANNDYYPKTYKVPNKQFTLTNLPSSGNIWINPDNDISYASGYGDPVYIITTNPSNSWYLDSGSGQYIAISEGRTCELSASVKANYNNIYLRTGDGVSKYDVSYTNGSGNSVTTTISSSTSSTRCQVKTGTNLHVTQVIYEDGYGTPLQFVEYTSGTFSTIDHYFEEGDLQVYSNGTRYLRFTASSLPTYTLSLYKNGGTWSTGKDPVTKKAKKGTSISLNVYSQNLSREGWTLLGWDEDSSATSATYGTSGKISLQRNTTLYAIWKQQRISITMIANGGKFSDTQGSEKTFTKQIGATLDLSTYSGLVSYDGYELLGWGTSADLTKPSYTKLDIITITSSTPTKFYAIWGKIIYVKCSSGVQTIKISNAYSPTQTSSNSFQKVVLIAGNPTITFTPTPFGGYEKPYTFIYQLNEGGQITGSGTFNTSKNYTYAINRKYITISATKHIDLFTWCGSDVADNNKIVKGQPVTNLTAESWNNLKDILIRLSKVLNKTITIGNNVGKGSNITADEFNLVRTAIQTLSSTALLPVEVKQGAEIKASYFNGGGSLKSAVNWIINQYYNNG